MMLLCIFLVYLGDVFQVPAADSTSGITQDSGIITAEAGATVTLKCFAHDRSVTLSWFQQSLGGKPRIVPIRMREDMSRHSVEPTYDERFRVESGEGVNRLTISHLRLSDSATYFCGMSEHSTTQFGHGAFLHIKTSLPSIRAGVHQPVLEPLHLGDSVNLTCTLFAEKCAGERSLYWFRHGADQPAIMHANAGRHTKDLESQTTNFTLNLTIKSASSSDAGMYYCALATCGEIFFGNGTRVEILGGSTKVRPFVVCCLSVSLAVSVILLLALAAVVNKLKKQTCSECKGRSSHLTCSAASDAVSQDEDVLHYAALSLNRTNKRHCQDVSQEGFCVYSTVKRR